MWIPSVSVEDKGLQKMKNSYKRLVENASGLFHINGMAAGKKL